MPEPRPEAQFIAQQRIDYLADDSDVENWNRETDWSLNLSMTPLDQKRLFQLSHRLDIAPPDICRKIVHHALAILIQRCQSHIRD